MYKNYVQDVLRHATQDYCCGSTPTNGMSKSTNVRRGETLVSKLDTLRERYLGRGLPAQHGQPTVTWCANQFNLSPNYFGDMIKKEAHITAQEYIRGKIVSHAQVLLRQTNMTINEIAEELGFAYPNHFTRMFHKATGYTPLKYRKGN